jgi:hypothetical protein
MNFSSDTSNQTHMNSSPAQQGRENTTTSSNTELKTAPPQQVAAKAYDIWLGQGCPERCDLENWRQAEEALRGGNAMSLG